MDAARPSRHAVGDRCFVDDTFVRGNGVWRYVYWAVDQYWPVIDVSVSHRRDVASARRLFTRSLLAHGTLAEVITDRAAALANVIEVLMLAESRNTGR
jgi:transposase-like protein